MVATLDATGRSEVVGLETDDHGDADVDRLQPCLAEAKRIAHTLKIVIEPCGLVSDLPAHANRGPRKVRKAAAKSERRFGGGLEIVRRQERGAAAAEYE